jgi:hypothetical protein
MRAWSLLLPGVALVTLAAHFFRSAAWAGVLACLLLVLLLPLRRRWVPALLQVCLAAGAAQWLWTAAMLVQQRMAFDRPWGRLALILGGVALLTAASALVFRSGAVHAYYRRA